MKVTKFRTIALLLLGISLYQGAIYAVEGLGYGSTQTGYEAQGYRMGSFIAYPEIKVSYAHNSNIFAEHDKQIHDEIFYLKPELSLNSNWGRHGNNTYMGLTDADYSDKSTEDRTAYFIDSSGWIDIRRNTRLDSQLAYYRLYEDRFSPNTILGSEPIEFNRGIFNLGLNHRWNALSLTGKYEFKNYDYEDSIAIDAFNNRLIINHEDRDRSEHYATFRIGYEVIPQVEGFLRWQYEQIDYDDPLDDNQLERSSDGYAINLGATLKLTHLISGDIYLGFHHRDYDDNDLKTLENFNIGAALEWKVTHLTILQAQIDGESVDAIAGSVTGFFRTSYTFQVDHELRRNIILKGKLDYQADEFAGLRSNTFNREDETFSVDLNMKYLFSRHFYVSGGYQYITRHSTINIAEFVVQQVQIDFGARL